MGIVYKMFWRMIPSNIKYEINTNGNERNIHTQKIMKEYTRGHTFVYLQCNGIPRKKYIHYPYFFDITITM